MDFIVALGTGAATAGAVALAVYGISRVIIWYLKNR